MNYNPIWIHSGWVSDTFIIWGETSPKQGQSQNGFIYPFLVSPFELKLRLFRHDAPSFYGTFITTTRALLQTPLVKRRFQSPAGETIVYQADEQWQSYTFPIEGIAQTLQQFIEGYPLFKSWESDKQLQLSDDFSSWLSFMDRVYATIADGAVGPATDGTWQLFVADDWYDAQMARFPEAAFSLFSDQSTATEQAAEEERGSKISLFKKIIDAAVRFLLKTDDMKETLTTWEESVSADMQPFVHSLIHNEKKAASTTQRNNHFGEQLGLKQTDPFQTALVLNEPKTPEATWSVSLSLADKQHPDALISMEQLMAGKHPWLTNPVPRLKNDVKAMAKQLPLLERLTLSSPKIELSTEEAYSLFTDSHEQLAEIGIKLIVPNWLKRPRSISVQLQEKNEPQERGADPILNWQSLAEFNYTIAIGDQTLDEDQFKEYVEGRKPFIYVDGEWLAWDPALAEQLKNYLERVNERYSYLDAWKLAETETLPDELHEVGFQIEWSDELERKLTELYRQNPGSIETPAAFTGTLRSYQKKGLDWLAHLRKVGFGGCLADDMGLGKSIQTICYILYVLQQQSPQKRAPFLLICPTSLLYNWASECERFAPELKVFIHHGTDRLHENDERLYKADLVLTSYTLALRDARFFEEVYWNGLILDEAQHIKNKETKQRKAIRKIPAIHRIALTGTPIENRLTELWSLMDLLNPSLLGSYQGFYKAYIRPIERDGETEKQNELQTLIRPFLLRRTKNDPATDLQLPVKQESTKLVQLSIEQAALYQAVVEDVGGRLHSVSSFERRAMILRAITRLKQICNHPAQFYKDHALSDHQSGKWDLFVQLIDGIQANGESVLIFTQYKEMGKMISSHLQERLHEHVPFLHGGLSRKQRQETISQFQSNEQVSAFVLSLKAGGVGLNLTKATNVIHYDRWWNPAVENQATDRAYRIGQTKQVQVYKLLTAGTVEERIDRLISGKQALADGVLASPSSKITELSDEELLALIQLNHQPERSH